jgi:pyrroloquinoline quinone biosynthesis protein B
MRIKVLGAAAGGGFPQWNCGCPNCRDLRSGDLATEPLTQECVAVSAEGERWVLLNASPEIRAQLESFPALWPRAPRHSPVAAVVLTNGDLDHTLGLLSLRESYPISVYATAAVRDGFREGNALYRTLERFPKQVTWRTLQAYEETELSGLDGRASGLTVKAIPAPGKPPVHLERNAAPDPGENIGVVIHEQRSGKRLAYFSAAASVTNVMSTAFDGADCVFFDGTFWASDELIALGLGDKRAEQMAHLPVGGQAGSLRVLAQVRAPKRFYIHINNTNPVLRPSSPERRQVEAGGWGIAFDGMEVNL